MVALGIIGPGERDILPALIKALENDKDDGVRMKVLSIFMRLKPEQLAFAVPALADTVKGDSVPAIRAEAARVLAKAGERAKPALMLLVAALKDNDPRVRESSAEAIGNIGSEARSAFPDLLRLLREPAEDKKLMGLTLLIPVSPFVLREHESNIRLQIVAAVGRIGLDEPTITELNRVLAEDSFPLVRKEVARTYGLNALVVKSGVPALAKALREDPSSEVRFHCAVTLGKMGPLASEGLESLRRSMLEEKDKMVRAFAVRRAIGSGRGKTQGLSRGPSEGFKGGATSGSEDRLVAGDRLDRSDHRQGDASQDNPSDCRNAK